MKRPIFVLGGCAYRKQVSTAHAGSVAYLAAVSATNGSGPAFAGVSYVHNTDLWRGRCSWLEDLIKDAGITWAISVDSDTSFNAIHLWESISQVGRTPAKNRALGLAPVIQADGIPNLRVMGEDGIRPMDMIEHERALAGIPREIEAGGLALAVFNLDWFRQKWPQPRPLFAPWGDPKIQEVVGRPLGWLGEDMSICLSIRAMGGAIVSLPVETEHHAFKG